MRSTHENHHAQHVRHRPACLLAVYSNQPGPDSFELRQQERGAVFQRRVYLSAGHDLHELGVWAEQRSFRESCCTPSATRTFSPLIRRSMQRCTFNCAPRPEKNPPQCPNSPHFEIRISSQAAPSTARSSLFRLIGQKCAVATSASLGPEYRKDLTMNELPLEIDCQTRGRQAGPAERLRAHRLPRARRACDRAYRRPRDCCR